MQYIRDKIGGYLNIEGNGITIYFYANDFQIASFLFTILYQNM
jgi:hypothetical protein